MSPKDNLPDKNFEKAIFGGYDVSKVDSFVERLTDETEALRRENGELQEKLKVVLERVVEYQRDEAAVHDALLRAQRLANEIITEAEKKAEHIIADAEGKHAEVVEATRKLTEDKKQEYLRDLSVDLQRLEDCRQATIDFVGRVTRVYEIQIDRLYKLAKLRPDVYLQPEEEEKSEESNRTAIEELLEEAEMPMPTEAAESVIEDIVPEVDETEEDSDEIPAISALAEIEPELEVAEEEIDIIDPAADKPDPDDDAEIWYEGDDADETDQNSEPAEPEEDQPDEFQDELESAADESDFVIESSSYSTDLDTVTETVAAILGSIGDEPEIISDVVYEDEGNQDPAADDRQFNFSRSSESIENGMHTKIVEVNLVANEPEPELPKKKGFRFGHEVVEEDTIPPSRPTFDFDSLQFGDNYDPDK